MLKAIDKWLVPYLRSALRRPRRIDGPIHIFLAICDHFEPLSPGGNQPHSVGKDRVRRWLNDYPKLADQFRDADGRPPQHTFFFPEEEYHPDFIGPLAELTSAGLGEVEIHLHHRHDTPDDLREKLTCFRNLLREKHGLLGSGLGNQEQADAEHGAKTEDRDTASRESQVTSPGQPGTRNPEPGTPVYGFIHGNWALCNSRPDGDWCGVNEELRLLAETGCYADFTFPSVPSPTQPRTVNSIYYAHDRPGKPRGHDRGTEAFAAALRTQRRGRETLNTKCSTSNIQFSKAMLKPETQSEEGGATVRKRNSERAGEHDDAATGRAPSASSAPPREDLLLVQGPLALNWRWRKWGLLPRIEHADLCASNPPTPLRADLWLRQHIHVRGRPDWVFIKLRTHGCLERNTDVLLGNPMRQLHEYLRDEFNDGKTCVLHYVTTREMVNLIHAAEDGIQASPANCRDYIYGPPPARA